jgi:hypothetical protein
LSMAVSKVPAVIPFDEIVPGATVRFCVKDGVQYLSIRDTIMCVCGKDQHDAARTWREMNPERVSEVGQFLSQYQFPGKGQSEQPVISFVGALKLVMFLPGEAAKRHRSAMADILRRYFAGDASLIDELEANQASDSPIAQMARASLAAEPALEDAVDRKRKREREDQELLQLKVSNVSLFANTMALINPNWRDDARLRLQTEDWLKNAALNSGVGAITNGDGSQERPISVTEVAQEMGHRLSHGQQISVGRAVAVKYNERYNEEPSWHYQWVQGQQRKVKSYTARDRDLIEQAILDVI